MDERLTEEELRIMVNDDKLFDEYNLKDMYHVCDDTGNNKACPDCCLEYTDENKHLFYTDKLTRCKECSKRYSINYSKQNPEKIREHSRRYREKTKELNNYWIR